MEPSGKLDLESIIDGNSLSRFQITVILLCALVAMIDGFDTQAIAFVAPEIIRSWSVDASAFGPVFGAGLLGGLIGAMIFGVLGDRFGRKPTLMLAIILFAAVSLATPWAASIPQLIGARFLTGLGLGGALPGIVAITSEYAPRRARATIVAMMFCGFPLGAVVGGIASAKMVPALGWASVFIAGGIIPLVMLPLFWIVIPESIRFLSRRGDRAEIGRLLSRMGRALEWDGIAEPPKAEEGSPITALFTGGRAAGTLLLWATLFCSLLLSYFLINWIPVVARAAGMPIESAILGVAALNLGAIVGCILIGRLADRFGPARIIGPSFALGGLAIAAMGSGGLTIPALLAATFMAGFLSIGAQMCTVALCSGFYETSMRATGIGWSIGIGRIGAIVGPVFGGLLIGAGVVASSLFAVTGLISLGAGLFVFALGWLVPATRRPNAQTTPAGPMPAQGRA